MLVSITHVSNSPSSSLQTYYHLSLCVLKVSCVHAISFSSLFSYCRRFVGLALCRRTSGCFTLTRVSVLLLPGFSPIVPPTRPHLLFDTLGHPSSLATLASSSFLPLHCLHFPVGPMTHFVLSPCQPSLKVYSYACKKYRRSTYSNCRISCGSARALCI